MSTVDKNKFVYRHSPHEWAWELYERHEAAHWIPQEVPMAEDIKDFKKSHDQFIKDCMLFFVQADVEVGCTYIDTYLPLFPDMARSSMFISFRNRESGHVTGYAYLVDSLGLDDGVFSAFLKDAVLLALHNAFGYWRTRGTSQNPEDQFAAMCATTLMGEGVMLFGLFAMLLNYQRFNRYKGMCTIVAWSIRDEDMHIEGVTKAFKTDERFNTIPLETRQRLYKEVYDSFMPLIKQFVSTCFAAAQPEGISEAEVHEFVEYQAQRRARQANIQEADISVKNPFPWFDQIVGGIENANQFETRVVEYSKDSLVGDWVY